MGRHRSLSDYNNNNDNNNNEQYHQSTSTFSSSRPSRPSQSSNSHSHSTKSVTDLLSQSRIEHRRHLWNQARRSNKHDTPKESVPWITTQITSFTPSPNSNLLSQIPIRNPNPTPTSTHRRSTPGPPPPLSWTHSASTHYFSSTSSSNGAGIGGGGGDIRRRHRIWRDHVVSRVLESDLMPVERKEGDEEDVEEGEGEEQGGRDIRLGAISLFSTCLRLISHHLDPPPSTVQQTSSFDDDDNNDGWLETHLSTLPVQHRMSIMEWGLTDRSVTWKSIKSIFQPEPNIPSDFLQPSIEIEDSSSESDDWEKEDDHQTNQLPILDFTYIPIPFSSLLPLLSPTSTIHHLSLSGIDIPFIDVVKAIPKTLGGRLESLGLADLKLTNGEEVEVGVKILKKWAINLEFLDISSTAPPILLLSTKQYYPPSHLFIQTLKTMHLRLTEISLLPLPNPPNTLFPSLRTLVAQSGTSYEEGTQLNLGKTRGFLLRRAKGDERWLDVMT